MHYYIFSIIASWYFSNLILLTWEFVIILFVFVVFSISFCINFIRSFDSKIFAKTWSILWSQLHYFIALSCMSFFFLRSFIFALTSFFIFFCWFSSIVFQTSNALRLLIRFAIVTLSTFCLMYRIFWFASQFFSRSRDATNWDLINKDIFVF